MKPIRIADLAEVVRTALDCGVDDRQDIVSDSRTDLVKSSNAPNES